MGKTLIWGLWGNYSNDKLIYQISLNNYDYGYGIIPFAAFRDDTIVVAHICDYLMCSKSDGLAILRIWRKLPGGMAIL